jgi:hypothetical protein
MALSDLSFKLYTDSGLTTPFGGTLQLVHNTSLSDNPQDFTFYFGSTDAGKKLQANSNPGVDQITLTPTDTIPTWQTAHAYIVGDEIEPTSPNGKVYKCTTAGTSHASVEPTWPTSSIGSTVADGTCVWTLLGPKHATTEIKLSLSSGTLGAATPGAALDLGTEIDGDVGNAVPVYMRITNAVTNVRNDIGHAEIGVFINEVIETDI